MQTARGYTVLPSRTRSAPTGWLCLRAQSRIRTCANHRVGMALYQAELPALTSRDVEPAGTTLVGGKGALQLPILYVDLQGFEP